MTDKTHAQIAYEAFLGGDVDWTKITEPTRDLWLKVAAAVLGACDEDRS